MKTFKNREELVNFVNENNYYYNGNSFDSYSELEKEAFDHFKSITQDFEDEESYYDQFGLEVGECHVDLKKKEKYFDEESNTTVTVHFYEGYVDSGVPEEDYFHGYFITEW